MSADSDWTTFQIAFPRPSTSLHLILQPAFCTSTTITFISSPLLLGRGQPCGCGTRAFRLLDKLQDHVGRLSAEQYKIIRTPRHPPAHVTAAIRSIPVNSRGWLIAMSKWAPSSDEMSSTAATRRISSPASARLQAITERPIMYAPPIPSKSVLRNSTPEPGLPSPRPQINRDSADEKILASSATTPRTAPPAYGWIADVDDSLDEGPVEGEKLAALRSAGGYKRKQRGGWFRIWLIVAVIALLIIALAIGLGVGLTVGKDKHHEAAAAGNDSASAAQKQAFPLGGYSIVTSLRTAATDCTSNPATWRCYPYSTYDASNPDQSMATFNWVISNTSATYATKSIESTADEGIPANLSISSTDNPLSINFDKTPLTYISSSSNSSSPRYTFSFTMSKAVFPNAVITTDNSQAECFFNQTQFTGTLYLSADKTYPPDGSSGPGSSGNSTQWPFAVEVVQSSDGGHDVPSCYEYANGQIWSSITAGLEPQPADAQCQCGYQNF